jgi:hypothetical protein
MASLKKMREWILLTRQLASVTVVSRAIDFGILLLEISPLFHRLVKLVIAALDGNIKQAQKIFFK